MLVNDDTQAFVAVEDLPLEEGGGAIPTKPIIASDAHTVHDKESHGNGRDVAQADVADNVVPPTLSEVGQNVLKRKFDNFVE